MGIPVLVLFFLVTQGQLHFLCDMHVIHLCTEFKQPQEFQFVEF
jgi:hypothetical protein